MSQEGTTPAQLPELGSSNTSDWISYVMHATSELRFEDGVVWFPATIITEDDDRT